ncbi:MAG TPA: prolyl oligopeptidase family serine peptidase [Tenuifilaceae bacterium]|mgnify:CR=1 FL=1|jgi:prolyl oligopeptidase|nr:prolyl oligopeptidase family serine peptidase [Bacteroidales bacterium]MDI9516181.1 prolyl oligopeptidase family serine peptidase [Bacteroidota bacterium]NLH56213.1 S9 family peptidase [Rikenellaceae bacterium]OQC64882.1 MAG: Prolyl endopeptidase precursor [Bacteroidetes bacterium ADurb.Bin008]HNV80365.1 prolyl oligopeptidase family serine peptidase [Tenuifilaceae bacterium]
MNKLIPFTLAVFVMAFLSCDSNKIKYPETKKVDVVDNYFGVNVADPYRWFEDDKAEGLSEWIKAQNEITFNYLSKIPYRETLRERLSELWNYSSISTPYIKAGKVFFFKRDGLQNQSVFYMQNSLHDEPKVLIDPNTFSEDGTVAISQISISGKADYAAYAIADGGSDWMKIMVRDIKTGKDLADEIRWVKFSGIEWFKDGFFYSRYDEPKEGSELTNVNQFHKVYYHKLGTKQSEDRLIFHNQEYPLRNYGAQVTSDENFLIISETESTHGNALYISNLHKRDQDFLNLTTSFEYSYHVIDHVDGYLYVLTNYRSPKYKLIKININSLDIGNWIDVLPESKDVLESCVLAGGKIIATYIDNVKSRVEVYDLNGEKLHQISLPTIGTVGGVSASFKDQTAFFTFTSFTVPSVVYSFDTKTYDLKEYFRPNINFDFDNYEVKQIFYKSKDGTEVPMFIVHKKGLELNGQNPTLLYGYGGFNASMMPSFAPSRLVWLENGGVYALANIRGGGEYGENWYRSGTKLNKQNVFDDFIAAAEYLIAENYTSAKKLAIQGGSNGGLLIGAVVNQRPDLFKVAIPQVGVMDMLRFHLFTIGWAWVNDYGSSEDSVQFLNLYKYSPIHNVKSNPGYPAILVTTADRDDRVVPAHSFKYIATLQEKQGKGANPKLIRIQTRAGHSAGTPTSMRIEEAADIYAFIFYNLHVNIK